MLFAQEKAADPNEGFGIYSQFPPEGYWLWIIVALVATVAVYFVFVRGKKDETNPPAP